MWRWSIIPILVVLSGTVLWARQGIIHTTDGRVLQGDIQPQDPKTPDLVTISIHGVELTFPRAAIASIEYIDNPADEFESRLKDLGPNDYKGRLALANWALERSQYDQAMEAAQSAAKINPHDPKVLEMIDTITKLKVLAHLSATRPGVSPTTLPAKSTLAAASSAGTISNYLSQDQINTIRQAELRPGDNVKVQFLNNVGHRYLASRRISDTEFNIDNPVAQALTIIETGDPRLTVDVKILDDPPPLKEFRDHIIPRVAAGCAASGCHGGEANGGFFIYPKFSPLAPGARRPDDPDGNEVWYTDFYLMETYRYPTTVAPGIAQSRMIDRLHPEASMLLQYSMARAAAFTPHPVVKGWAPIFRDEKDAAYQTFYNWITTSLKPIEPDYGINFSLAATRPSAATQPAAESQQFPPATAPAGEPMIAPNTEAPAAP